MVWAVEMDKCGWSGGGDGWTCGLRSDKGKCIQDLTNDERGMTHTETQTIPPPG